MFYLLDYWHIWERYLGKFGSLHAYVKMTPVNGFRNTGIVGDEFNVRTVVAECLIARDYPPQSTGPLPDDIIKLMDTHLGVEFATRLREFDYMSEVTAEQIKLAMKRSNGGGVPFKFVKEHATDPTKYWQWT